MPDKIRWLLSELRARSFDDAKSFIEDDAITIVVHPELGAAFAIFWFDGHWYLGACAKKGATYRLPGDADIVAVCVTWAAAWTQTPPTTTGWGSPAPDEVVNEFGLHLMSRAEVKAWFDALTRRAMKRVFGAKGLGE